MSWKIDGVYSPVVDLFHELFIMMLSCRKGSTLGFMITPSARLHMLVEDLVVVDWEEQCYLKFLGIPIWEKGSANRVE